MVKKKNNVEKTVKYPIVKLTWLDACGDGNTCCYRVDQMDKLKPIVKHSVGWEVANDKDKIVLVFDAAYDNGDYMSKDWLLVPKSYIVSRKVLKQ